VIVCRSYFKVKIFRKREREEEGARDEREGKGVRVEERNPKFEVRSSKQIRMTEMEGHSKRFEREMPAGRIGNILAEPIRCNGRSRLVFAFLAILA
jgi:hypothetical protein